MDFKLNSSTLASSGVIVAHLTPTLYCLIALAASIVTEEESEKKKKNEERGKKKNLDHLFYRDIQVLDHSI